MRHEKKEFYLFSIIMSLIMSGGMSFAMALVTLEPTAAIKSWPSSWLISFVVALPLCILVVPLTKRLVVIILARSENKLAFKK